MTGHSAHRYAIFLSRLHQHHENMIIMFLATCLVQLSRVCIAAIVVLHKATSGRLLLLPRTSRHSPSRYSHLATQDAHSDLLDSSWLRWPTAIWNCMDAWSCIEDSVEISVLPNATPTWIRASEALGRYKGHSTRKNTITASLSCLSSATIVHRSTVRTAHL